MQEFIARIETWSELIGPNPWLQALIIAIAAVFAGKLAELVLARIVGRLAASSRTSFDDELVRILRRPVFVSFVLLGLGLATNRIEMPQAPEFITLGALKTIAIFVWLRFGLRLLALVVDAMGETRDSALFQARTLPLLKNVGQVVAIAVGLYFVFLAWDIDVAAWIASAGIIGLALSFAARDTLANLFAGVFILADAPYKVGDFIILESGERGMVTHVGLRSTRILTRDDIEITVPNGVMGNSKIINEAGGRSERHRIRVPVGVAYASDIDEVIAVLERVASEHEDVCATPAPRVRFRAFGDSSLDVELLGWIDQPVDRGRVLHELNCAVYKAFAAAGIEIPFPQRDLHIKAAPAAATGGFPDAGGAQPPSGDPDAASAS